MPLTEGQLITAPFLPGPARIKKVEQRAAFVRLEVVLEESGEYRPLRLSAEQVAQVTLVQRDPLAAGGDPEQFFLLVEANRIRLAHQFDPLLAVSVSQVDPLPHQIEAVYHYALDLPRIRFLIADDPGAGKTVMAGLILKEMQYRRLAQRVLIVAPGHLKYQWQRELKEKFNSAFRLIDRSAFHAAWGENVWEEHPQAITSIDFLKQDDIKATLNSAHWDLVIVDEAHKMSAYAYETRDRVKIDKTRRYQVGEVLSRQSDHLLFLTATPHRGDEENFRLFLDLLRPGFFAKPELLHESVERQDNPLFVRRLKEDMKTFDGRDIFPPRHVQTIAFRMTDAEVDLYNAVTSYVKNYFDQAKENRNIAFAMIILQRRLTSSVHAILSSLQRRRDRLQELLRLPDKIRGNEKYEGLKAISEEDLEDMSEEERWEIEERLEHLTIARNIEDVHREIEQLDDLIAQAQAVRAQEIESKLVALRDEVLTTLDGRKLLIFTEHKDTLWYLAGDGQQGRPYGKLREWGYSVNVIHGGMSLDARIEAERVFRNDAQIMVATEAAGEGINLQFCSLMVNYDIPWNPNRLEQRMGRIHRYGQDREVFIWNMVSKDTREGQILDRLFMKLQLMQKSLGTDRVFDIIGEVIPGANLSDLLKDAIFNQRRMEDIEEKIESVDEAYMRQTMDRLFLTSLATRFIDYTTLQRETLAARENRLVPEYVQDFFLRAFSHLGGRYTPLENAPSPKGFRIDGVPFELRQWSDDYNFRTNYGRVYREYRRVTFDKAVARHDSSYEYVAPGHPLLEALNETILSQFSHNETRHVVFTDPAGERPPLRGLLWFVEGVVRDGAGRAAGRRIFALHQHADLRQHADGHIETVNPAVLWDLDPAPGADIPPDIAALLDARDALEDYAIEHVLFPYRREMTERRRHDAEIKERYGLRSLAYLIQESNQKLLDYEVRESAGENMEMPLLNERRRLEQLQERHDALQREIRLEQNLTVDEPRILGVAAVLPAVNVGQDGILSEPQSDSTVQGQNTILSYEIDAVGQPANDEKAPYRTIDDDQPPPDEDVMRRNEEIEIAGMRVARKYEEARGWNVEDVSAEKHGGFDLRSICFDESGKLVGIRYIEVKARARSGKIRLTANEWKKARHFGDGYWLYVVTEAATDQPQLTRIHNPAARFMEDKDIFATGFEIQEETWQREGEATDT